MPDRKQPMPAAACNHRASKPLDTFGALLWCQTCGALGENGYWRYPKRHLDFIAKAKKGARK